MSSLAAESKRLARATIIYGVPNFMVRGISVLLAPVYTRHMLPGDYGVLALSTTLISLLTIVLSLSLTSCIPRLYTETTDRLEHQQLFGTVLVLTAGFAIPCGAIICLLGATGHLEIFRILHYEPHLRLIVLTSVFACFPALPTTIYMSSEQPAKGALVNTALAFSQLGLTIWFVVIRPDGAVGALRAGLYANALVGIASVVLMLRMGPRKLHRPLARAALVFSLPTIPHVVAAWALSVSDRLILERYVSSAELGRYSFAYLFSLGTSMFVLSLNQAWGPMALRHLKDPAQAVHVPQLGTYVLLAMVWFALGVAVLGRDVMLLVATNLYVTSTAVVSLVVLGALFQGLYCVWAIGTWFSMRTALMPVVTSASALSNIGLNLWLVPRYGVLAAAASTAIGYASAAVLHGYLAHRLHPIAWQYRRWTLMFLSALVSFGVGNLWGSMPAGVRVIMEATAVVAVFPTLLRIAGFFTKSEIAVLGAWIRLPSR